METVEQYRARKRAERERRCAARVAQGLPKWPPRSEDHRARDREYMRRRRAAGYDDGWYAKNKDRHHENTRRWRAANKELAAEQARELQRKRRSTPWGVINNRIWSVMHGCLRRNSPRPSKYTAALGYLWSELRAHLEAQFTPEMSWENWGVVWELDHIEPVSSFRYTSPDDPLFKEAWALSNLRPLACAANASKGARVT